MTHFHIIYENEGKEKEIAECKKRISKTIDSSSYYIWRWRKEKEIAECEKKNKQIDWLKFILYMKMKERKKK